MPSRGERLGRWIGPQLRKNQHVLSKLRAAFPHWSRQQVEAMAPRIWGAVGWDRPRVVLPGGWRIGVG